MDTHIRNMTSGLVDPKALGPTPYSCSPGDLLLWLDASDIKIKNPSIADGDNVTTWEDLSGKGATATNGALTAPIFKTNQANGKPAVQFTGSGSSGQGLSCTTAANFTVTSAMGTSVFMVVKAAAGGAYFDGNTAHNISMQGNGANNITLYAPYSATNYSITTDSTNYHLVTWTRGVNTVIYAWLDTVYQGASAAAGTFSNTNNTDYWLGTNSIQNNYGSCSIAELIILKTNTTSNHLTEVNSYLMSKYGLW